MVNSTSSNNMTVSQATAECEVYELSMDMYYLPSLLPNFTSTVINCYTNKDWSPLLDRYGTHYVYQTTLGGRATYEVTLSI